MQDNYSSYIQSSKQLLQMLEDGTIDHYEHTLAAILLNQTVGFKKKSDGISISQWMKRSGLSKKKVISTLESLKKKRIIKKQRQKASNNGHLYSRYTLTLVSVRDKGSSSERQGLVSQGDTQVINNTSKEREGAFSDLFEKQDVDAFITYLLETEEVKSKSGYTAKIRSQIEANDQATMEAFNAWLPHRRSQQLYQAYASVACSITVSGGEIIKGNVRGIDRDRDRFVLRLQDPDTYRQRLIGFESLEKLEAVLKDSV